MEIRLSTWLRAGPASRCSVDERLYVACAVGRDSNGVEGAWDGVGSQRVLRRMRAWSHERASDAYGDSK